MPARSISLKSQMSLKAIASVFAFIFLTGSGCSLLQTKPAEPTAFLVKPERLKPAPERSPYHLGWNILEEHPGYAAKVFKKVYLKPVNLAYLGKASVTDWRQNVQLKGGSPEEVKEISDYLYDKLLEAIVTSTHKFLITSRPDADTLVVEAALVEYHPTQVSYKVAGVVAGAVVPGGSLVKTLGNGSIGMEVKFSDGATGEILGEVADRRDDKAALIDFNNLTRLGHAKGTIDDWAKELNELLSTPRDQQVKRTRWFELVGW